MIVRAATATTTREMRPNRKRTPGARATQARDPDNGATRPGLLARLQAGPRATAIAGSVRRGAARLWVRLRVPAMHVLRLLALAGIIAGMLAAGRMVEAHVRTSPAFATRSIEVTGHAHLTRAQVLAAAQLAVGENVFVTAPEDAQAALRSHPWVASATVTRRLPDTFEVHLQERTPVALLALDQLYLVGADGSVFKPLEPSDPSDMPVITGIDPDAFARDRSYRTSVLVNAVALLHDYRDVGLWRRTPIAEIHALPGEAFLLYVGKEETQVRLGKRPFRKKLRRFRKVIDRLERQKAVADYVYLDNVRRPDRVTVRLRVQ